MGRGDKVLAQKLDLQRKKWRKNKSTSRIQLNINIYAEYNYFVYGVFLLRDWLPKQG